MPPPLDLTGRRFGRLTVLSRGQRVHWGKWQSAWVCRCDCGAVTEVPQSRLPHYKSISKARRVEACETCRAHACVVCGAPISVSSPSVTCSPDCATLHRREVGLRHYYAKRRDDPSYREAQAARHKAKWADMSLEEREADGRARYARALEREGRDEINARARARYAERMADPEYAAKRAQRRADRKARIGRDEINAQARAQHAARMADPEFAAKLAEQRAAWRQNNREAMRALQRRFRRRKRAEKIARELGDVAKRMQQRLSDDEKD